MEEKPIKEVEEKPIKKEESGESLSPSRGQRIATVLLSIGLCGVLAYAFLEHRSVKNLVTSRNALSAALDQEQSQLQILSQKLLAAESVPAAGPQPLLNSQTESQVPVARPNRARHHSATRAAAVKAQPAEDPWKKEIQSELSAQQEQIAEGQRQIQETKDSVEQTRTELESNLQSTRDDLNGSIAKNHEELVALEKKGERNYYEFDLRKAKQFQKVGPMSVSLRKSNTKHDYCDLELIVNDSEVSKKHVNLYEPVLFHPEGFSQPLEVVINSIGKDAARGYISAPKYKPSELTANSSNLGGTAPASPSQSAPGSSTASPSLQRRSEIQQ